MLAYCNALIDSIDESTGRPTDEMSLECIKIALKYNKLDLLTRWIANRRLMSTLEFLRNKLVFHKRLILFVLLEYRLTFSFACGKLIEEYARLRPKNHKNSYELALFVYQDIKAYMEAAICMAKLGRFSAMMDFISQNQKHLYSSCVETLLKILVDYPCIELANLIMDTAKKEQISIPVDKIVSILLDSDQPENGLIFLKSQIDNYSTNELKNDELKKFKSSFETLVKFSFLSTNDEQFTKEIAVESRDQLHSIFGESPNKRDNLNKSPEVDWKANVHEKQKPKKVTSTDKHAIKEEDESQS